MTKAAAILIAPMVALRALRRKRLKFQLLIACSLGCGGSWCETGLRNGPRRSTPPRM